LVSRKNKAQGFKQRSLEWGDPRWSSP